MAAGICLRHCLPSTGSLSKESLDRLTSRTASRAVLAGSRARLLTRRRMVAVTSRTAAPPLGKVCYLDR
jgi:hypothetical protein